mmetsp:Transcript_3458/g.3414  ORF Transcript_3458/g.3414 Transcript_3458/m.3414 type:complete len:373 (-) Transcript_3458:230-1348(-)
MMGRTSSIYDSEFMLQQQPSFNLREQQIFEIFDIKYQELHKNFSFIKYFYKDQRRKVLATWSNSNKSIQIFNLRDKTAGLKDVAKGAVTPTMGSERMVITPQLSSNSFLEKEDNGKKEVFSYRNQEKGVDFLEAQWGYSTIFWIQKELFNKSHIELEPKEVEFHNDRFYIIYKKFRPYVIDVIKNGILKDRHQPSFQKQRQIQPSPRGVGGGISYINERYGKQIVIDESQITIIKITHIKVPVLNWANRLTAKPDLGQKIQRMIITGVLELKEIHNGTRMNETKQELFLMVYNLDFKQIEKVRTFDKETYKKLTCVNYGPYDNGYIMVGTSTGTLISLDFITLDIIDKKSVFEDVAIQKIEYDPTELIFVGS